MFRRRTLTICTLLLVLFLSGCAGMVAKQMQAAPVQNRLYLHPGARVGDYALYESFDKSQLVKMEIVGMDPDTVEVAVSWPRVPEEASFLKETSYHFFVSPDGTVQYAHMVDTTGNLRPLRVAKPGDFNYIAPMVITPLRSPEAIVTRAGTFKIKDVYVFDQKLASLDVHSRVTSVYFMAQKVHFGLVRQAHVMESRLAVTDVLDYISKRSPASKQYKSLMDFISSRSKNRKYISGMDLVETN